LTEVISIAPFADKARGVGMRARGLSPQRWLTLVAAD
jgi:hypothetical protein